jgi:hypothetical protein
MVYERWSGMAGRSRLAVQYSKNVCIIAAYFSNNVQNKKHILSFFLGNSLPEELLFKDDKS